jgi:translocation and assembly module TamA
VRPGRTYRFGEIQVTTQPGARIPAAPIWRETRVAIPEGRTFSDKALEEARRRLVGMGLFGMSTVSAGAHDEKTGLIAVDVRVGEAPFRTLRLGGGARLDLARTEVRLLGEWTHRDFLGGMRRLTARAEGGWAFIPDLYAVVTNDQSVGPRNGPIARLRIDFEQPQLLERPSLRGKVGLTGFRNLEQTYAVLGAALAPGILWQPRARVSIFPSYHIEANYLSGAPVDSAATAPLTLGCETADNRCLVWLSYLEQSAIWDRRDNPLEPRRGFYLGMSVQEGGGPLQGDFSYFRVLPDARAYFSFGDDKWLTLSTRLKVGELWPTSGVPEDSAVVTRFYAGGPVSMRGFGDRRLSPLLLAPAPGNANVQTTVPIGGNGLIDGSFEARVSLTSTIRLAGFVDYGQVTSGPVRLQEVPHLLWAAGIGLRYLTPIGPIRLDIARRLPFGNLPMLFTTDASGAIVEVPSYPVNTSCFGLFGSQPATPVPDGSCVLHVSIGEAF